jgi:hypothetical protein
LNGCAVHRALGKRPGVRQKAAFVRGLPFGASALKFPFLSYSTKHHLKRRIVGTDWLFLAAAIALVVGVGLVLSYA